MIQSKNIKNSFFGCGCKPEVESDVMKVYNFVKFNILYHIYRFFRYYTNLVIRALQWAKFGFSNYDWDGLYLYEVIHFKLERMYKALTNGMAIQEKEDMIALKRAIKICERLRNNEYENKYYNEHQRKWGSYPKLKTEPVLNDKGQITSYRMLPAERSKVKTKKDKKQEKKEFLNLWKKSEVDRCKDLDDLNIILKKHSLRWWD